MTRKLESSVAILVVGAVALIAAGRGPAAGWAAEVKVKSDVYSLPPIELLRPISLGYSSALADLIWAHVLVTQGLRMSEQRPFDHLEHYLDALNTLDPKFREPYRLANSLLTFQANDPDPEHSARAARRILERGLSHHPLDAQLWMDYGEFLAYVGNTSLRDDKEKAAWRVDGARALVRAGELGSKDQYLYWHSISAVTILSKEGERGAMLHFLERVYAMTEDEELKRFLEHRMNILEQGRRESRNMKFNQQFDELWRSTTPFANRTLRRVLGPPVAPWNCAGWSRSLPTQSHPCSRDWNAWSRSVLGQSDDNPVL